MKLEMQKIVFDFFKHFPESGKLEITKQEGVIIFSFKGGKKEFNIQFPDNFEDDFQIRNAFDTCLAFFTNRWNK